MTKIESLESYLSKAPKVIPQNKEEYLESFEKQLATERLLQVSIEIMIDISILIMKLLKLGVPTDEENIFEKLKPYFNNIETYKEMKRFRNVLVHQYEGIDSEIVYYNAKNNMKDFQKFILEVKKILRKKEG